MNEHDRVIVERVTADVVGRIDQLTEWFRPMCPRCDRLCDVAAVYCCECGCSLYPAWSGRYERT